MDWSADLGKPHMDINDPLDSAPPSTEVLDGSCAYQGQDNINRPVHYRHLPVECIQVTEHMNFCLGNVIKYVYRCNLKGGVEDLRKARWYLDREIARRNGGDTDTGC